MDDIIFFDNTTLCISFKYLHDNKLNDGDVVRWAIAQLPGQWHVGRIYEDKAGLRMCYEFISTGRPPDNVPGKGIEWNTLYHYSNEIRQ